MTEQPSQSDHESSLPSAPEPTAAGAVDDPSEFTYAAKVPPDHPGLRLNRARPRTLKAGPALAAAVGLLFATGAAVAVATRSPAAKTTTDEPPAPSKDVAIDDAVRTAPGNDAPLPAPPPPRLGPPLHGRSALAAGPAPGQALTNDPSSPASQRQARRQAWLEERDRARAAPLLANLSDSPDDGAQGRRDQPLDTRPADAPTRTAIPDNAAALPAAVGAGAGSADQNMQQRKNDFLSRSGVNNATRSDQPLLRPRRPYELLAGAIIPTSLITGIDSDLPGQILGQVRENVYDTVTGEHLLIPQGSRLLATYDSMVGFGQSRVLICWNRLIRPDGSSVSLECMPGIDLAGYSGFDDDVDHHWWRIIAGVAIGSLVSATAQASQGNVTGVQPTLPQLWAGGAAAGVNQATQQITAKNLQIQPTIKIRPGYSVNVLVTKDLVLPHFPGVSP